MRIYSVSSICWNHSEPPTATAHLREKKPEWKRKNDLDLVSTIEVTRTLHIGAHTQWTRTVNADFCTSASATISPSAAPKIMLTPADASSGNSMRSQKTACTRGITQQMASTSNADRTVSALEEKLLFMKRFFVRTKNRNTHMRHEHDNGT